MIRPLPRLDDEWTYTSIQAYVNDIIDRGIFTLQSLVPQLTIKSDHKPWVTLRYPTQENPAVMASLKELGYSGIYSGIVTGMTDQGTPIYAAVSNIEKPTILTGVSIVHEALPWISIGTLRTLIEVIYNNLGFMIAYKCKSPVHMVDRFQWDGGLPSIITPTNAALLIQNAVQKDPPPPELLSSLIVSVRYWPDSSWFYIVADSIRRAHIHGIDKTRP